MNTQPAGAGFMARGRRDVAEPSVDLLQAALHHLLRHSLLGCSQSAGRAARLLDLLAETPRLDCEIRGLCERMSAGLGSQVVPGGGRPYV